MELIIVAAADTDDDDHSDELCYIRLVTLVLDNF